MLLTVLVGRGREIGRRASCIVQKLIMLLKVMVGKDREMDQLQISEALYAFESSII